MAANIKYIATSSDKLDSIPIKTGQIIFSRDDRTIYLDTDERTAFRQILLLSDDTERRSLISPVNRGFYFVEDNAILWNYMNGIWYPLNQAPDEQIVFDFRPTIGQDDTLYVDNGQIYQWDSSLNTYKKISGSPEWEAII